MKRSKLIQALMEIEGDDPEVVVFGMGECGVKFVESARSVDVKLNHYKSKFDDPHDTYEPEWKEPGCVTAIHIY